MRFLKWALFFAISFAIAWITIFTFLQEQFQVDAPARILMYRTPPIPIYYYLIAAFAGGLFIGLAIAIYNYLTLSVKLHKQHKEYRELSDYTDNLKKEVEKISGQPDKQLWEPSSNAQHLLPADSDANRDADRSGESGNNPESYLDTSDEDDK